MSLFNVRSLHGKFFLLLLPIVSGIAVLMLGLFSWLTVVRFEQELQAKEQELMQSSALVMAEPLWNYQYEALQQIITALMTDPDIVQVIIEDEGGNEVLSQGETEGKARVEHHSRAIVYQNAHIVQQAGRLQISFSHQRLSQLLIQRIIQDLVLIGLMTLGFLFCVLMISRYVIRRPLSELLAAINQSQQEGSLQPVQWRSDDEIGQIIREYNQIQVSLTTKEKQLHSSRARYRALYHNTPALMLSIDEQARITEVSDYLCQQTGQVAEYFLGEVLWSFLAGDHVDRIRYQLEQALYGQQSVSELQAIFRRDDQTLDILITAVPQFDDHQMYKGHLVVLSDITQLNQAYRLIEQQANFDSLTGLANRHNFQQQLNHQFADHHRPVLTLIFIDLDGFKQVNDTLGHLIGDQLLIAAARRMSSVVQQQGLLARLGGDEFAVLLVHHHLPAGSATGLHKAQQADQLAGQLLEQLASPFNIAGHPVRISGSIGMAVSPEQATDSTELLRLADIAMYQAKKAGKNACCRYQAECTDYQPDSTD